MRSTLIMNSECTTQYRWLWVLYHRNLCCITETSCHWTAPHFPLLQPLETSLSSASIILTIFNTSFKWNHAVIVLLWLGCFTWQYTVKNIEMEKLKPLNHKKYLVRVHCVYENSSQTGNFQSSGAWRYRMVYKVKMRKLFNLTMISYYNGDFQTTGDWLKMIIFSLFRKWLKFVLWFLGAFSRSSPS